MDFIPGILLGASTVAVGFTILGFVDGWMRRDGLEGVARWGCAFRTVWSDPIGVIVIGTFVVTCVADLAFLS
ncbi:MAG: hypothetical protein ACUVRT_15125 [Armatimonadota bacterium]